MDLAVLTNQLFAGTYGGGIFRSTNNGLSWISSNTGLGSLFVRKLTVNGSNLFAGTEGGIYRSQNNGNSWTEVNNGIPVSAIFSLGVASGVIYASPYSGGIYRSTNNGSSWTAVNAGLPSGAVFYSFAGINGKIFAGSYSYGLYVTTNQGLWWSNVNQGLPSNVSVPSLTIMSDFLYAGTSGSAVWNRELSEMIGIRPISGEIPSDYTLMNYPNPFNPSTKIKFSLPRNSDVKLILYDAQGKQIGLLISQYLREGIYEIIWDGSSYPSGVYFYRLTAHGNSLTEKMVLIK
jgi:ligand-binding sensor domain-containing protein